MTSINKVGGDVEMV